ncbi:methyltransferase domain-containing protein [Myxococcus sp. CA033]|uniref:methyltransferase domain-containing protein n=1 Tax=Myxococcus sp. CA033 TaxID=2741516 RepID=UPI00157AE5BB|nr:methyltransferase domain-containing protein [Myxococcus sp. CA033]NTX40170.1 methyltransferase domain-containing protein [Myxococcus sp. CA033]
MYKDIKSEGPNGDVAQMRDSLHFWKTTNGHSYRELVRVREGQGHLAYGQQERVLTALIRSEQRRLDRALSVLEFGCGFGRHATSLSQLSQVRYHGYDISESMTEPLRLEPPASLRPVEERIFCGDDPLIAVGGRRFDLVFSVSTLVHNPSERIPALLETMGQMVLPGGMLVLVENPLMPTSVWDPSCHPGSWHHAFADLLPEGWDLHHGPGLVDHQDVYVLKRQPGHGRRYFQLVGPEAPRDESQPLTLEALHARAMPRLLEWAGRASKSLSTPAANSEARVAELTERLAVESERFERRQRLQALSDDLARLRASRAPFPDAPAPHVPATSSVPGFILNAALDTRWSADLPQFGKLMHVFHQDWHGIRAAAGYLPGQKLAIASDRVLDERELRAAIELVERSGCSQIILHGYSSNARDLVVLLRRALGSSVRILALWHGSSAQFHYSFELDCFAQLIDLRRRGVINALATVKPGMHLLAPEVFPKTVLNLPPTLPEAERSPATRRLTRAALIPTPNDWRKNFFTNLFACQSSSRIDDIYVTASYRLPDVMKSTRRIHHVARPSRTELFELVRRCDIVLNASLSECQPMTGLEALALRVPCVYGALSLGALDAHPYQRLAQISGVDSVEVVAAAIERMLALRERSPEELTQMMVDYERALTVEAVKVLEEFVQS